MKQKKQSVRIFKRKRRNGHSIFLIYYTEGKQKQESTGLFLSNKRDKESKERNAQLLKDAEVLRAKMEVQLLEGNKDILAKGNKILLSEYFEYCMKERKTKSNYQNWECTLKHLMKFIGKKEVVLTSVDKDYLNAFKLYLATTKKTNEENLSANSQYTYFNKLRACIREAFNDGLIPSNPNLQIKGVRPATPKREYLTKEEVKKLIETPCHSKVLKRAFLFSVFTGMRWSDVNKLIWGEIREENNSLKVVFRQKKTTALEYLFIPDNAIQYLGERINDSERVFRGLKYNSWNNQLLQNWVMFAGINKKITFHCARHTNATLLLNNGVDIYTVSKILGHKNVRTTEIYTKVVDKSKEEAMRSLDKAFN